MQELIAKAETLLEALPYIQKFAGSIFVIKYGGSFMDAPDPEVRNSVVRDIALLKTVGIHPVVVHGGGKAITRSLQKSGLPSTFVQGQRVTDQASVAIVDRVLSREINPEVVAAITAAGGRAKGFAGPDIFGCRKASILAADGSAIDLGFVGEVTSLQAAPIMECITQGMIPVISPTARGKDGQIYNCNADVAAAQAAIFLKARRLVFMSDVPGLLEDPKNPETLISKLEVKRVADLKKAGVIDQGMIPKVDSAVAAIKFGVEKVSLVDGRIKHSILLELFTDQGLGTEVVA